ncbi:MAG: AhpC/TSA family protein [Flavobacteriales bacterium]|nr:AhpC/TSA family protein [Flavobacteriales bacterium]
MQLTFKFGLLYSALSLSIVACQNDEKEQIKEPEFGITAEISDLNYKTAYLNDFIDGELIKLDSCSIVGGKFSFKGKVELPEVRYINFNDGKERIVLFVQNDSIHIGGSFQDIPSLKISGSATHNLFDDFKKGIKTHDEKLAELTERFYAADAAGQEEEIEKIDSEYYATEEIKQKFVEDFINMNKSSVVAPFIGLRFLAPIYDIEKLEALSKLFEKDAASSVYTKLINERLALLKSTEVGVKAPEFSQNDTSGNPISLSEFKGKYVLIDFWASWCGPCRAENPNVVAAYKKFNKKGFEIFGVSLDENKAKWIDAIHQDKLTWKQVSDLKGWGNEVAKMYGVNSIPHSILLDKEGTIVAKNLRGDELHKKLAEVLE